MTTTQKRLPLIPLLILSLVLIAAIVILAVLVLPVLLSKTPESARTAAAPATPPQTITTSSYGGKYYYAGMPHPTASYPRPILVLTNIGYVTGYDETRHDPTWTCFRLFKVNNLKPPPRHDSFRVDGRTMARVGPTDFARTGYDRGHCAPDKAIYLCYGAAAVDETYLMSNMLPETPPLNRHVWMLLEKKEIEKYAQYYEEVWVITGGIFDEHPKTLSGGAQIPRALYRIIVDEENGAPRALAFIIPQDVESTASAGQYLTSVDEIEKETGLDFLSDLPDDVEVKLEAEKAGRMW